MGWQTLYPESPTTPDIVLQLAQQLNAEALLYLVSMSNIVVESSHAISRADHLAQQLDAARELFPADVFNRVRLRAETTGCDTVIHPEQLLLAATVAINHSLPGPRGEWNRAIGAEFLLRVLDCLDVAEGGSDRNVLVTLLLRRSATPKEEERYLLARYFDLFVTRPRLKWGNPSPFDDIFHQSKGYTLEEYLALGLALVHQLFGAASVAQLTEIAFDTLVERNAAQMRHLPHCRELETELVADIAWFKAHAKTVVDPEALALTDFEAFYDKPLIRLGSGAILPISTSMILQRLSMGIYWELFTAKQTARHGISDINAAIGALFQDYCTDALRSAVRRGVLIPESDINGSDDTSHPDAVIAEATSWIMIEMTVSALPIKVLVGGDTEAFRSELEASARLGSKLRQPITAAQSLLNGTLTHPQLHTEAVADIYPVLLFLRPFPQHALIADELARAYPLPPYLEAPDGRRVRVHKLNVLSAEELEVLEPMLEAGLSLSHLLQTKEEADPFLSGGSLKNFLFAQPGWAETPNDRMRRLLDDLSAACSPVLTPLAD
jgi:hypothetical protein